MKQFVEKNIRIAGLLFLAMVCFALPSAAVEVVIDGLTYTSDYYSGAIILEKIEAGRSGSFTIPSEITYDDEYGYPRTVKVKKFSIHALDDTGITELIIPKEIENIITDGSPTNNKVEHIVLKPGEDGINVEWDNYSDDVKLDFPKLKTLKMGRNLSAGKNIFFPSFPSLSFDPSLKVINSNLAGSYLPELTIPTTVDNIAGPFAVDSIGSVTVMQSDKALSIELQTFPKYIDKLTLARPLNSYSGSYAPAKKPVMRAMSWKADPVYYGFENIGTLIIADNLTEYPGEGVVDWRVVRHLELGDGITYVPAYFTPRATGGEFQYVFYAYAVIKSVILGKNVTSIEAGAFQESYLERIDMNDALTEIGESAFYGCKRLSNVNFGKNVKTIGPNAFYKTGIESIVIPDNVKTIGANCFSSCAKLQKVVLGSGLESIGESAFSQCGSDDYPLTEIIIPDNVKTIGANCFNSCEYLQKVVLGSGLETIGGSAFAGCSSVKDIRSKAVVPPVLGTDGYAFSGFGTRTITVPFGSAANYRRAESWGWFTIFLQDVPENPLRVDAAVDKAGNLINLIDTSKASEIYSIKVSGELNGTDILVLNRLHNLEELDLSEATIVAGGQPYYIDDNKSWHTEADKLLPYSLHNIHPHKVSLPRVKEICSQTFLDKLSLVEITIPNTVETIGSQAFSGCKYIKEVNLPESIKRIDSRAFFNCSGLKSIVIPESVEYFGSGIFESCNGLADVVLPDGMQVIPYSMFEKCSSLKSINLPSKLTKLSDFSFSYSGLTEVILPDNFTEIGRAAFDGCRSLTKVVMPSSLKKIEEAAFSYTGLSEIEIPQNVEFIGNQAFMNSKLVEVKVPASVMNLAWDAFLSENFKTLVIEDSEQSLTVDDYNNRDEYFIETLHIGRQLVGPYQYGSFKFGKSIRNLSFGKSVTDINVSFEGCADLKEISLPENVKNIKSEAFARTGLTKVSVWNTTPPVMTENTFSQTTYNNAVLHVKPEAKTDYWLHMYWGKFMNIEGDLEGDSGVSMMTDDNDLTINVSGGTIAIGGIAEGVTVDLFDAAGRKVYSGNGRTVTGLSAGLYIVSAAGRSAKVVVR